ncbi:PREDICTED: AUGMIN subunit 2-like [Nicotiana attenuata]|uniref:AUGMIN subunit 2-like n=1 Tax=Nicotiana attenuata TaxID=49451 RepID=UPI0009048047|nr:PREDICTED: AUGMIN subunit 2-like [Nicotiana attenuata]
MMGSESNPTWVGRKPMRRLGGMSDALSIASELGFSLPTPPNSQEEIQNLSSTTGENGDDLIRVLKELTAVQRKIADLQVELQGRKEDKNVAHLTHVSEMEKKIETLQRITTILKDVIQNKVIDLI